ncbi:hypothetical protein CYMTET_4373 [Cymbomonas tetramitiformis]|uniref:Uncharacterized protein n=1 Tax=Cymbomonas tetramitiformis TaxID=36881 RepID=A0AAE0LKK0_9CHLO|nr:hypothetical protein CYMTET_4373 [Cymbomonas tetramitiformis]
MSGSKKGDGSPVETKPALKSRSSFSSSPSTRNMQAPSEPEEPVTPSRMARRVSFSDQQGEQLEHVKEIPRRKGTLSKLFSSMCKKLGLDS